MRPGHAFQHRARLRKHAVCGMASKPLVCSNVRLYHQYFSQLQDIVRNRVFPSLVFKRKVCCTRYSSAPDWVHIIYGIIVCNLPSTTKTSLVIFGKHVYLSQPGLLSPGLPKGGVEYYPSYSQP